MNSDMVNFDLTELIRIQRVLYARWLGIAPREWDAMTYAEQCDVMEIKRAYDQNTQFDRHVRQ